MSRDDQGESYHGGNEIRVRTLLLSHGPDDGLTPLHALLGLEERLIGNLTGGS